MGKSRLSSAVGFKILGRQQNRKQVQNRFFLTTASQQLPSSTWTLFSWRIPTLVIIRFVVEYVCSCTCSNEVIDYSTKSHSTSAHRTTNSFWSDYYSNCCTNMSSALCCLSNGIHDIDSLRPRSKARQCTDLPCLFVFITFWVGLAFVAIYAFMIGNPLRMIHGSDSFGNVCGHSNSKIDNLPFSGLDLTERP